MNTLENLHNVVQAEAGLSTTVANGTCRFPSSYRPLGEDTAQIVFYVAEEDLRADPLREYAGKAFVGMPCTVFRSRIAAKRITKKAAKKEPPPPTERKRTRPAVFPGPLPRDLAHSVAKKHVLAIVCRECAYVCVRLC